MTEFAYQRKGGKIALTLDEGDELVFVVHTDGNSALLLATAHGNAVRYDEETVRVMGRSARGVRGIRLDDDDFVVGAVLVEEGKMLMTITELGYGKQTPFDEFRLMKNRGGSGVCCHKLSEKTGNLAGIAVVAPDDDLMLITDQGTMIRTPVSDINVYSRTASGVIVMRTGEDQRIANFTKLAPEQPEGEDQLIDAPELPEDGEPAPAPAEDVVVPTLEIEGEEE